MKKVAIIVLLFLSGTNFSFSQTQWKVSKSAITFKIKNAGLTVDGSFGGLIAVINFDAATYSKGFMEASIDVNTINTGIDLRNSHLKKEEYFNVSGFPKISLKSTSFSKEKDGTFKGFFKLTIKAVTKDVIIPFSYTESGNTAILKASFTLNRIDYTVGGNSWTMSDDVTINFLVNTIK
ncbi:MAG TPA: YceI family protein [Bacteroidia bacterium]|jgi:polyisoprenoid-binding protein YceI|nr:YceI family protein [Bacteroidia bacterium]